MGVEFGMSAGDWIDRGKRRMLYLVASVMIMWLCIPASLIATGNDVSVTKAVKPKSNTVIIPPIPDGSMPAEISVTITAADGYRLIRLDPPPEGWEPEYIKYYLGTNPGEAYYAEFSGELQPTNAPTGAGGEPDYTFTLKATGSYKNLEYRIRPPDEKTVCVGQGATFYAEKLLEGAADWEPAASFWTIGGDTNYPVASSVTIVTNTPADYDIIAKISPTRVLSDTATLTIIKVELKSDKAVNSPLSFQYGNTELYDVSTEVEGILPTDAVARSNELARIEYEEQKAIDSALTIYYKDVIDESGNLQNFDVTLKVTPEISEIIWNMTDGPGDSGVLVDANSAETQFRNPTKGGRYIFDLDENESDTTTKLQMWLPVAGPDIKSYWESEVTRITNWGAIYREKLLERAEARAGGNPMAVIYWHQRFMKNDFLRDTSSGIAFGLSLDWLNLDPDAMYSGDTPCGLADVLSEDSSAGDNQRLTICGKVVDFAKRNNMGYALIAKEMGFRRIEILLGPELFRLYMEGGSDVGSPDHVSAIESYRAGCDLSDGVDLETVMDNRGLRMLHPDMRAAKEWPSYETTSAGLQLMNDANTLMGELIDEEW